MLPEVTRRDLHQFAAERARFHAQLGLGKSITIIIGEILLIAEPHDERGQALVSREGEKNLQETLIKLKKQILIKFGLPDDDWGRE